MINPKTETYIAIFAAVFAFNGLIALWGVMGLWAPLVLGILIVATLRWGMVIGSNTKTLEYEKNRNNNNKKRK